MRPAFDAVLFDLDGVLIHSRAVWEALLARLCRQLGYPPLTEARFAAIWGQGIAADVENIFVRHTVEELAALYDAHFLEHADAMTLEPGGPQVFEALIAAGIGLAVVTNTPRPLADALLERAGLAPPVLIGGTDCPRAKPAPDMVLEAASRLGVPPERALMVGDTTADRGAAQAAGATFCGFGGIDGDLVARRLSDVLRIVLDGPLPTDVRHRET